MQKNFFLLHTKNVERHENNLRYRRLNWRVETKLRIKNEFEYVVKTLNDYNYPINLFVSGSDVKNEETIQLTCGKRSVGVVEQGKSLYEGGSCLVATQTIWGTVVFTAYPWGSERITSKDKELILFYNLDPVDVTPALIRRAIRKYFLFMRQSSVYGQCDSVSYIDRFRLLWMYYIDVRNRTEILRSVFAMKNEWAKILVPIVFACVGFYIAAKFPDLYKDVSVKR